MFTETELDSGAAVGIVLKLLYSRFYCSLISHGITEAWT